MDPSDILARAESARTFLGQFFGPTRIVRSPSLSKRVGADVYLKLESEQPTGSFKVRGALYALAQRLAEGPLTEVVAASTGNHGAAVAYAGRALGVRATIFVPEHANPVKLDRIKQLGAQLVERGTDLTEA